MTHAEGRCTENGVTASWVGENVAALTLDLSGVIRDCNYATEDLFKYRRYEILQRHVSMLESEPFWGLAV